MDIRVPVTPPPADGASRGRWPAWRAAGIVRRPVVVAVLAACAVFALAMAVFSTTALHRLWGLIAAATYGGAAVIAVAWKARGADLALVVGVGGALLAPLGWLAAAGQGQPEVSVIVRSAQLLVRHGTPYQGPAALAATGNPNAFDPYLPVMTLFGLPRALFGKGPLPDPRLWFTVAFIAVFWWALKTARARDHIRWTVLLAATPLVALPLAVGGTDLPVLGLLCLGLAFLWDRPRPVAAGLALGVAAAMKATAWPALAVAVALIVARDSAASGSAAAGWRTARTFLVTAACAFAVLVGPVAVLWPRALVENTISFPLGLTRDKSHAASPLPGHLLADTGTAGHWAAVVLLITAGVAVAVWLVASPPRTLRSATWRLVVGLTLMFALAPATRFGYFIYPAGLCAWLWLSAAEPPVLPVGGQRGGPPLPAAVGAADYSPSAADY